ncbi:MAG: hypothetical protein OEY72_04840, partial [Gammaproteobacteria bacterium]|nr:hypothetical protein [Gammaproteobacteria bacterium]
AENRDAATCDLADYRPSVRPDPAGTATEVTIGLILADLMAINDVDQTVALDVLLTMEWTDHRLVNAPGCRYPYTAIWTPEMQLINSGTIRSRRPPEVLVEADGRVISTVRYEGTVTSPWHLKDFPFDTNDIVLQAVSLQHDAAELPLQISGPWTGRAATLTIPDWAIGEPTADVSTLSLQSIDREVSIYEFRIPASRLADYYIYKFVLPLCLIVMMSWSVFWIDARQLSAQLQLAATSMLTLIAYQFTVNDLLPKVGYLTAMDRYLLSSSVLVFLALVEALTTGALAGNGRVAAAAMLDRASRWAFPVVYVIVILVTLVFR